MIHNVVQRKQDERTLEVSSLVGEAPRFLDCLITLGVYFASNGQSLR